MAPQKVWLVLLALGSGAVMLPALLGTVPAQATIKLRETLQATENCEAMQSIRKRKNAGNVRLTPGERYRVIGKNRSDDATHYLLQLEDATPSLRWVPVSCGSLVDKATPEAESPKPESPKELSESEPEETVEPEENAPEEVADAEESADPDTTAEPEERAPEEIAEPEDSVTEEVAEPEESAEPEDGSAADDLFGLDTSRDSDFLLALSWQPTFCETRPTKTECLDQEEGSYEASNLALHGLWPQPRGNDYCGVSAEIERLDKSRRWDELPPIELSEQTREALENQMPGYASGLHLHEWYKHGTCYSNSPEEYYRESLDLMDQVNESLVQDLFEDNLGRRISGGDIRLAFDQAFGKGAGRKVEVTCSRDINQGRRLMVQELRILLKGKIEPGADIAELIAEAPIARSGCREGLVDFAGVDQ